MVMMGFLLSLPAAAQDFIPGEIIVKLKGKSSSVSNSQFFGKVQGKMALKGSLQGLNMHRLSLKAGGDIQAALKELKADPSVEYAEPNYVFRKFEDSLAAGEVVAHGDVGALYQSGDKYTQSFADTGVEAAWPQELTLSQFAEKPIVAVIDTGVDYNHVVFQQSSAIWTNTGEIAGNGVDDDGNGFVDDVRGWNFHGKNNDPLDDGKHGTHVAGIILGIGQNIFAPTLEESKIRIMPLKFLGADGSGSTSDAVAAIYYAVNNGAQVINNSWGGSSYSQALHDALTYAYDRQVMIVSAAGNSSKDNDAAPMYPASYPVPGQLSVAATSDYDNLASFSNYGASTVHLAAPGVSIFSTIPNQNYQFMSGTSMATPFVAGLAAMIMREAPTLTGYQVRNVILNSVKAFSSLSNKVQSSGRVDVYDAIMASKSQLGISSFQPDYKAQARSVASENASVSPKGCGTVSSALLAAGAKGGGGPAGPTTVLMVIALSLLPLIVWNLIRLRARGPQRRKFDRFVMNSSIRVNVGGRELIGHMRTISEGGLSFEANTMLEKGGVLTMQIQSPDGHETIQVQGHVVWCEQNKAYGVQFDEAKENALSSIRAWSQRLVRASI